MQLVVAMGRLTAVSFSSGPTQVLVAMLLVVAIGLCLVHFEACGSDMGDHGLCANLGAVLLIVFTLSILGQASWAILDPAYSPYVTSVSPPSPPPKRSPLS
jgi:hypothetical protein